MRRRSIAAICACLLPLAAPGAAAPAPAPAPAAANGLSPAENAAQDMMSVYEDLCLNRFPNQESLGLALAARRAVPLDMATTKAALLGHPGTAWTVTGLRGSYVMALEMPPARRCVVTGQAAEDAGVQAVFSLLITSFAKAHEFGELQLPPVRSGQVGHAPATLQIIAAAPDGRPRQAFVNMGVTAADGKTQVRLTRELAAK